MNNKNRLLIAITAWCLSALHIVISNEFNLIAFIYGCILGLVFSVGYIFWKHRSKEKSHNRAYALTCRDCKWADCGDAEYPGYAKECPNFEPLEEEDSLIEILINATDNERKRSKEQEM